MVLKPSSAPQVKLGNWNHNISITMRMFWAKSKTWCADQLNLFRKTLYAKTSTIKSIDRTKPINLQSISMLLTIFFSIFFMLLISKIIPFRDRQKKLLKSNIKNNLFHPQKSCDHQPQPWYHRCLDSNFHWHRNLQKHQNLEALQKVLVKRKSSHCCFLWSSSFTITNNDSLNLFL